MKTIDLSKVTILFIFVASFVFLGSCKKDENKIVATLSPDEYIDYTVNGTSYNYLMPTDHVSADSLVETATFIPTAKVYGDRLPNTSTEYVRIAYYQPNIGLGTNQELALFAVPQTEIYPYYATAAAPIYVSITEYGNIGEFIAGNFSGLIIGSMPNNFQYNIKCRFRVKRRI